MEAIKRMKKAAKVLTGMPETRASATPPRHCPICGYEGPFVPFGLSNIRAEAMCPDCKSLERHRQAKLLLDRMAPLPQGCSLLHFAPELATMRFLRPLAGKYVTTDLMRNDTDLQLNIEALDLPDESFDAIVCFHVLEHVDDRKALAELFRVLRPGGVALLAVPIIEGWAETYEVDGLTTPEERFRHFGQEDHVRWYGRDFRDRVREAGFALEEFTANGADAARHGLIRGETIFVARRAED